ncbi:MAG: methylmalonyl-CoA mutase family protein, partial [Deltaproteobacteria bacterium]|nr:methylmalonyl-CoA mutase family protein [Deltaproteobacteria bacterium]
MTARAEVYKPRCAVRVVTATSLFDGHDAAINIMRRILQATGAEVIHLGHNRSVHEIVDAAIEEDAQGIAVSSYQGGHIEFFKYMVDLLKEKGAPHIKVFGGGGGVILSDEAQELEAYGIEKIYSPEDGVHLGLQGIINDLIKRIDFPTVESGSDFELDQLRPINKPLVAKLISAMELAKAEGNGHLVRLRAHISQRLKERIIPVLGITGTGGAGKSSLTDELILRFLHDFKEINIGILSTDPSRRRTGGALLGDRIRMNAIGTERVYMRSLATRKSRTELSEAIGDAIEVLKAAGFDLVIVETAGIGQGDAEIIELVDLSTYVMTPEFGAPSQLEKIEMLDFADLIVVNKFEKRGGDDAVREVRKQVQRNRGEWDRSPEDMPVFGTIASKFNDDGVTALYQAILDGVGEKTGLRFDSNLPRPENHTSTSKTIIVPPERTRYLAEIAETVRAHHRRTGEQAEMVRRRWHFQQAAATLEEARQPQDPADILARLKEEAAKAEQELDEETRQLLKEWPEMREAYSGDEFVYKVREREFKVPLHIESLS